MSSQRDQSAKSNRRDFFKKAAAIGFGATLGGFSFGRPRAAKAQITLPKEPAPVRPFGRAGVKVSSLSMGDRPFSLALLM